MHSTLFLFAISFIHFVYRQHNVLMVLHTTNWFWYLDYCSLQKSKTYRNLIIFSFRIYRPISESGNYFWINDALGQIIDLKKNTHKFYWLKSISNWEFPFYYTQTFARKIKWNAVSNMKCLCNIEINFPALYGVHTFAANQ